MAYVYVYLDPRKPGCYIYDNDVSFEYEPFYVGKGSGSRDKVHLNEAKNKKKLSYGKFKNNRKTARISAIIKSGLEPIIIRLLDDVTDVEAESFEHNLTEHIIGRLNENKGPLLNIIPGGTGMKDPTGEIKAKISKTKTEQGKDPNYRKLISRRTKQGMANMSDEAKEQMIAKRNMSNTTEEGRRKISENTKHGMANMSEEKREKMRAGMRANNGKGVSKHWKITDPLGNSFVVFSLRKFCQEMNVDYGYVFYQVVKKPDRKRMRFWTIEKID